MKLLWLLALLGCSDPARAPVLIEDGPSDAAPAMDTAPLDTPPIEPSKTPRVLICHAEPTPPTWWRTKLESPAFSGVDLFDCGRATPSIAELRRYGVVLVFSNRPFHATDALGDRLAEYVDAYGNVVLGMLSMHRDAGHEVGGRWKSAGYACILPGTTPLPMSRTKGRPHDFDGPAFTEVVGIMSAYRSDGALNTARGARSVWSYEDGVTAVCRMTLRGRRLDLNFGLGNVSFGDRGYLDVTADDGVRLVSGALRYAAGWD